MNGINNKNNGQFVVQRNYGDKKIEVEVQNGRAALQKEIELKHKALEVRQCELYNLEFELVSKSISISKKLEKVGSFFAIVTDDEIERDMRSYEDLKKKINSERESIQKMSEEKNKLDGQYSKAQKQESELILQEAELVREEERLNREKIRKEEKVKFDKEIAEIKKNILECENSAAKRRRNFLESKQYSKVKSVKSQQKTDSEQGVIQRLNFMAQYRPIEDNEKLTLEERYAIHKTNLDAMGMENGYIRIILKAECNNEEPLEEKCELEMKKDLEEKKLKIQADNEEFKKHQPEVQNNNDDGINELSKEELELYNEMKELNPGITVAEFKRLHAHYEEVKPESEANVVPVDGKPAEANQQSSWGQSVATGLSYLNPFSYRQ